MEAWREELYANELWHHGIKGQQWGEQNGPPYPLSESAHDMVVRKAELKKKRRGLEMQKVLRPSAEAFGTVALALGGLALAQLMGTPIPIIAGAIAAGATFVDGFVFSVEANTRVKELDEEIKAIEEGEKMAAFLLESGIGGSNKK